MVAYSHDVAEFNGLAMIIKNGIDRFGAVAGR